MTLRPFALALSLASLAFASACDRQDKEPTGAPGNTTVPGAGTAPSSNPQPDSNPSGGTSPGNTTSGTNSSQGTSGGGTPVTPPAEPPASAASN